MGYRQSLKIKMKMETSVIQSKLESEKIDVTDLTDRKIVNRDFVV